MSKTVTPYHVPSVTPAAVVLETVTLDDFDLDDIREYLSRQDNGTPDEAPRAEMGNPSKNTSLVIFPADLDRIETLAICGQTEHARQHAIDLISAHIARPL